MANLIAAGKAAGKPLLIAGCVPQGDRKARELTGLSLLGESVWARACSVWARACF
jgi:threonylcarbamoyladenosine tRNA methylthiotransferase CDKAL1